MIILREKDGERVLPVLTTTSQAMQIMMRSRLPLPMPVPITMADITLQLLRKFDIRLIRVELTAIKDGMFFCNVVAEREGEERIVNFCPAHEGLELAVTTGCPIMIDEELFLAQYMHKNSDNSFAINISVMSRRMLEDALQNAVENENYEAASFLRDELAKRPEHTPGTPEEKM